MRDVIRGGDEKIKKKNIIRPEIKTDLIDV